MAHPLRSHLLVALQIAAVAGCCWPPPGGARGSALALALSAAGAALGGATLAHNRIGNFGIYPEPGAGSRLVTSGPYRYSRHPMYVALALLMAGVAGFNAGWSNAIAFALLLAVLHAKARVEERGLNAAFADYAGYARRTPRFLGLPERPGGE